MARINTGFESDGDGGQGSNQTLAKKFKVPLTMF
ncbi:hypothetical protein BRAO375_1710025 [Bradyrhizobium sp. ORS 375]|nr:hypothetical protein BRAO375_1710025 [Bradyrhizobium sp. ORS 375]